MLMAMILVALPLLGFILKEGFSSSSRHAIYSGVEIAMNGSVNAQMLNSESVSRFCPTTLPTMPLSLLLHIERVNPFFTRNEQMRKLVESSPLHLELENARVKFCSTDKSTNRQYDYLNSYSGKAVFPSKVLSMTSHVMAEGARILLESSLPEPKLPELPPLPKPEVPQVPELPKPELPHVPPKVELPPLPKLEVPKIPEISKPELPKVPEISKPELPKVPEIPKPEMPKIPEIPKPELPVVPKMEASEVSKIPKPELPEVPKVEIPKVPEIPKPELPKVPEIPKPETLKVPEIPKPELPQLPKVELPPLPKPEVPKLPEIPKPH
ncbi:protein PELPK1-like [Prosopis cineraria]|uniref:protein PELPK1-like n=1 Tax=Prosopis cineraria TaxID=364024 RepID=UPI00240FCE1F|nr:protein PELPK1-like [Prosopis cineraria]